MFSVCDLCAVGMLLFDPGCCEPEGSGGEAGRNWSSGDKGDFQSETPDRSVHVTVLCP